MGTRTDTPERSCLTCGFAVLSTHRILTGRTQPLHDHRQADFPLDDVQVVVLGNRHPLKRRAAGDRDLRSAWHHVVPYDLLLTFRVAGFVPLQIDRRWHSGETQPAEIVPPTGGNQVAIVDKGSWSLPRPSGSFISHLLHLPSKKYSCHSLPHNARSACGCSPFLRDARSLLMCSST